jgi:hypothetical protein
MRMTEPPGYNPVCITIPSRSGFLSIRVAGTPLPEARTRSFAPFGHSEDVIYYKTTLNIPSPIRLYLHVYLSQTRPCNYRQYNSASKMM